MCKVSSSGRVGRRSIEVVSGKSVCWMRWRRWIIVCSHRKVLVGGWLLRVAKLLMVARK